MSIVDAVFERPKLFHYLRLPIYLGAMPRLARALALQEGERVLDVGCGTGTCATLANGHYVGVDTYLPYLAFSRRRLRHRGHRFVAMNAFDFAFADHAFDKALVVNMVHHFEASMVDRFLVQLKRVVKKRVVLMDAAPETANRLERFLLNHDRGDHVRVRSELRALLMRHYDIEREETFHNTLHITPQVLFCLTPR